ncbi:hypothetical protein [Nocardia brasiliensis]|uniref:hypothetical protein n=1 Tax=Nocardia brasiliensis TaxID=37326 RepID=UPI0006897733|nr:hypothetical protein [Nocardia brasiliensis]
MGRNFINNRLVVEGMLCRLGTWDRMFTTVVVLADSTGNLDWVVWVDSTIVRVHQHGAGASEDSVTGL